MERLSSRIASRLVVLVLLAAAGGAGCSGSSGGTGAGPDASTDASSEDASLPDGSVRDASTSDATSADGASTDGGSTDGALVDGTSSDGASTDGASSDGESTDGASVDGTSGEEASTEEASTEGGSVGEASTDGSSPDASALDGGAEDGSSITATTGLVNPRTVPVTPSTPLAVASGAMLPANGATGVPVDTLLRIGFDSAPTLGATGTISIFESNGTMVDTINVADPYAIYNGTSLATNQTSTKVNVIGGLNSGIDQVRVVNYIPIMISGNTATIFPHNNKLAYGTTYYVTIDNGLFNGTIATVPFAGIAANAWTFTVKPTAPTTLMVAADNSADFATVQGAIDAIPVKNATPLTVSIAPGVYQELLFIRSKKNITFLGTNNGLDAVIQYDNCDGFNPTTGGGQAVTAAVAPATLPTIPGYNGAAAGPLTPGGRPVMLITNTTGIVLDGITLENLQGQGSLVLPTLPTSTTVTAGATSSPTYTGYASAVTQAETLYFNTSFTNLTAPGTLIAEHSNFISYQDTLQLKGFSWFYDSFVTGDVDFIWGDTNAALFERCEIKSRFNTNGASVVQSRAYLGFGTTAAPASFATSYPGFVFLNSALTKEPGTFTAYLARSSGAAITSGTAPAEIYYLQYDIVSYVGCTMDTHIAPVGWNVIPSNPPGANVRPNPVTGWREYGSLTPDGLPLDVSQRLVDPAPAGTVASPGGSLQLSTANVTTFFPDRAVILQGATDGTYVTTGLPAFNPTP